MLNISPDAFFYFKAAVATLFIIFLITISWGTKRNSKKRKDKS
jgi:hypothetical protein